MENFHSGVNATLIAFQYVLQAYTFCYEQLKEHDIAMPAPDQLMSYTQTVISALWQHSPAFVRQLYSTMSQLPIKSNFLTVLLVLAVLYVIYSLIMSMFRWVWRFFTGFVKFSFVMALVASVAYVIQQYLAGAALIPGTETHNNPGTKSY